MFLHKGIHPTMSVLPPFCLFFFFFFVKIIYFFLQIGKVSCTLVGEITFEWSFPEHACLANEKKKENRLQRLAKNLEFTFLFNLELPNVQLRFLRPSLVYISGSCRSTSTPIPWLTCIMVSWNFFILFL